MQTDRSVQAERITYFPQTMTNTLTTDIEATLAQINEAAEAGADIVRPVLTSKAQPH